jgi:hypothetical protein
MGLGGSGSEQGVGSVEQRTVGRAEQAVIAYFDESVREHVLQKTTDKLVGRPRAGFPLRSGCLLVLERDMALCKREDAVVADGHAKDVRSKVSEGVLATADRHTVHDPVLLPYVLIDARAQSSLV